MHAALERAESEWRRIVDRAWPLSAAMPVIAKADPKAPASFAAHTDNRAITIELNRPAELEDELTRIALPCWSGHPIASDLPHALLLVVLFHELFHPLVCPNGRDDEAAISRAIARGIRSREPALGPREVVLKVDHVKNLVWDVVVNVTLLARCRGPRPILPSGAALPVLYVLSAARHTTDALIALAGAFQAALALEGGPRDRAIRILLDALGREGIDEVAAEELLRAMSRGLCARLDAAALARDGVDKDELLARADLIAEWDSPTWARNRDWLLAALAAIFDASALRYAALEGLAHALAPLVPLTAKAGSIDPDTRCQDDAPPGEDAQPAEKAAGSLARTLDDLADELGEGGVKRVLEELAGNAGGVLDAATASAVQTFARDELLKRSVTPIDLRAPAPGLALLDVGQQLRWELVRSQDLSAADLARLDVARLVQVQVATGLPMLLSLSEDGFPAAGDETRTQHAFDPRDQDRLAEPRTRLVPRRSYFKLNEFALRASPVRAWTRQQLEPHLPDNWVVYLDSSGSMCGAPFELLLRAVYGLAQGLHALCRARQLDLRFGVVNFSSRTVWSGLDSFVKVHGSHTHPTKRVLFEQQNGDTRLDPAVFAAIERELAPGKTIHTLVTDGEIANEAAVYAEVERIASRKDTVFLFLEISQRSALGKKLEALAARRANVISRKLDRIDDLASSFLGLLVRYA